MLRLTLEPTRGNAAWDVLMLRGKQMLELQPELTLGQGVPYPRFRFEVPPNRHQFSLSVKPSGNVSRQVRVLDPSGDELDHFTSLPDASTTRTIDVAAYWPKVAGASYRGPFNDSDRQYSVVADGPIHLSLDDIPSYATTSAVSFFRTAVPQIAITGDTALDLGDGPLKLDASGTGRVDGMPLSFAWDLGDGTTLTGPRVDGHTYAEPGSYRVTLRVTGEDGTSAEKTLEVKSAPALLLTGDAADRIVINAPDYTAHTGPELVKDDRINSIGQIITYWSGDDMNVLTWPFEVKTAGRYQLITKFANNTEGISGRRYWVDDQQPDPAMKNVAFPHTGGWSRFSDDWQWQTLTDDAGQPIVFDLSAGRHELKVGNTDGGLAVDYFVFQRMNH